MSTYVNFRDGGKTNEEGFNRLLRKILSTVGVMSSSDLAVTQRGAGANKSVDIAAGDVFLSYNGYGFHAWNTATLNDSSTVIADNTSGNPRKDAVVAYIDLTVIDATNSNNPGALKFKVVQGTPAGSPSAPDDTAVQSSVGAGNPFLRLANVDVANGFTSIVNSNITDTRTKSALTPDPLAIRILQFVQSNNLGQVTATNQNVDTYWGQQAITPKSSGSTIYAFLFANGLQNGGSGRLNVWMVQDTASAGTTGTAIGSSDAAVAANDSTGTNGTSSVSYIGSFAPGSTTTKYVKALVKKQDTNTTWFAGANSADSRILLVEVG